MTKADHEAFKRGSSPVGYLDEFPEIEAKAITYLRLWCHAPEAQAEIWNELAEVFGPEQAKEELRNFESLVSMMLRNTRRPLMRHQLGCKCVGSDEAAFAHFIAAACSGEREDAMLIASFLVKPEIAPIVTGLAENFGFCLRRFARRTSTPRKTHQTAEIVQLH